MLEWFVNALKKTKEKIYGEKPQYSPMNITEDNREVVSVSRKSRPIAVFGEIVVESSENVTVGDENHFNGPVTIKQYVLPENNVGLSLPGKSKEYAWQRTTWTVLLVAALILTITTLGVLSKLMYFSITHNGQNKNDADIIFNTTKNGLQFVTRTQWIAQPSNSPVVSRSWPSEMVIISHTGNIGCKTAEQCIRTVRVLQSKNVDIESFPDIIYNFVIGGDGRVYIGLDWDIIGYHTNKYNNISIGIIFLGNFEQFEPDEKQIHAALLLIETGVQDGKLVKDYELFAQCQLSKVRSPGKNLYLNMINWPHFNNSAKCTF